MPVMRCTSGGKAGWKYGESGKCYTGPDAKQKAINQGLAITGGTFEEKVAALVRKAEGKPPRGGKK